jgi:hypothetical protein
LIFSFILYWFFVWFVIMICSICIEHLFAWYRLMPWCELIVWYNYLDWFYESITYLNFVIWS